MKRPDVAVVGAGPAGLIAAEILAAGGAAVTIYDRMASPARKFLMAGRGGLNLTHSEPLDRFLDRYGPDREFLESAIRAFPPSALRDWADGFGAEAFVGSSGRVFPKALKASPLLRAWLGRLASLGVVLESRQAWQGWNADGGLKIGHRVLWPDATILALGGASWPRLGSDGSWRDILAGDGIAIDTLVPSNAGVTIAWPDRVRERYAGTPLKRIALTCGGRTVRGEAMITKSGLEGGAVYALSRQIRAALATGGTASLSLDLLPDMPVDRVVERLAGGRAKDSRATRLRKALALPPAAIALLGMAGDVTAQTVKSLPLVFTGQSGLERAISTAGGIARQEINTSFMLTRRPGVFAAGEMLSWDAPTGGYLLQACLSSGVAAAKGCLQWLDCPGPATITD
ncbi:NAD(P)/FAD-dependent oxidoreductase [soil metagenome]